MNVTDSDPPLVVSRPRASLLAGLFAATLIGAAAAFILYVGVAVLLDGDLLGLFLAAVGAFMVLLLLYVLRDTRGKAGWRLVVGGDGLGLDLPRGRSLTHRPAAVHAQVPFKDIEALEVRLEAYPGLFGLTAMQRGYILRLKNGERIFLCEDRALRRASPPSSLAEAAQQIARRVPCALRDLGMAVGSHGFLGLLFVRPPALDAASVGRERQEELWAAAERTSRMAGYAIFAVLIGRGR